MRMKGRFADNFKWSISTVILVTLTMAFLSGVTVKAVNGEKITITWWYETILPRHLEAQEKNLIEPFERAHPNIEIKTIIKGGGQLLSLLRTAIAAGTGPDIIMTMGPAEANRYARVGTLIPLDKYVKEEGLDKELAQLALEVGRYMGEIYSLPKTFESMGIVYNKTLFEKNGWKSPTNREEWEALCNGIKAKDILPVSSGNAGWRPTNEHFVTVYLNHYAGPENVYKALTGQLAWDNSLFVEAIEMFKQDFLNYWPKPDVYFSLDEDVVPLIATRQAAMMVVGSWAFQWFGNPAYWPSDDQWGWVPFPSLREGVDYPMVDIGVGTTLSVNKNSKHSDETAKFLVWMLGYKEGIGKLLRDFPGEWLVPIEIPEELIPAEVDPVFVKHFRTQSELIKKGAYGYTTWTFLGDQVWEWVYEGIEQVWLGQITAEEYMEKWEKAFKKDVEAGVVPPIPERR